jgi:mannosyl-3-phosphoglycerate phosphatase
MDVIFTDLDGTLLDRETYGWEAAGPALDRLRRQGVPWLFVTSKTRAEVELWRRRLGNEHPFIVENGGAAFVPLGYFAFPFPGAKRLGAFEAVEWGTPYEQLVAHLQTASRVSQCRVRGFHQMTPEEVAELCELPLHQAVLAKEREYDEPFLVLDAARSDSLAAAIADQGCRSTRGGRFWHILGAGDKGRAVDSLTALFARANGSIRTIGLGDGLNDASFLDVVSIPVLIRSAQVEELKLKVPRGVVTERPGPEGWNDAVLALIGG